MSQKIFLVGLPGAGKTTLGKKLANDLKISFLDLDAEIEKHTHQSIRMIFAEQGEDHFRRLETQHLSRLIETCPAFVLATGGGTPCFFDNMEVMNSVGQTVFINTPVETIKKRLQQDTVRPLMQTNTLEELMKQRENWYAQAQHSVHSFEELYHLFKS